MKSYWKTFLPGVILIILLMAGYGCEHMPDALTGNSKPSEPTRYSFTDILIPGELSIDKSESFVFESTGLKAGTLFYSGYVDVDSLKNFFQANMPKDGWRLRSIFRFPKVVLLFEKPEKVCIIEIIEKTVMTHVEIWVAPSM